MIWRSSRIDHVSVMLSSSSMFEGVPLPGNISTWSAISWESNSGSIVIVVAESPGASISFGVWIVRVDVEISMESVVSVVPDNHHIVPKVEASWISLSHEPCISVSTFAIKTNSSHHGFSWSSGYISPSVHEDSVVTPVAKSSSAEENHRSDSSSSWSSSSNDHVSVMFSGSSMLEWVPLPSIESSWSAISWEANSGSIIIVVASFPWVSSSKSITISWEDLEISVHSVASVVPDNHHIVPKVESHGSSLSNEEGILMSSSAIGACSPDYGWLSSAWALASMSPHSHEVSTVTSVSVSTSWEKMKPSASLFLCLNILILFRFDVNSGGCI